MIDCSQHKSLDLSVNVQLLPDAAMRGLESLAYPKPLSFRVDFLKVSPEERGFHTLTKK